ncbi:unnamed protein product [Vitrella brassicaformis CCMP3155]|uniref:Uncharacterized protein n=1 Tax=Vitrella brassicaformis (strain CCMP3155) TaxID=1169540 RepID=A0A0G4FCK4_VITBC|nr:unnamed protein product [Vitrella brassicaformis CCMP3155]|eukprot:CEM10958.1 unnamed protein product [Vitrella brassicaformis CCMP3155]
MPHGGNYVLRDAGLYLLVDGEILRPESLRHRQDLLRFVVSGLRPALREASAGPFVRPSAAVSPTASDTTRATETPTLPPSSPPPSSPSHMSARATDTVTRQTPSATIGQLLVKIKELRKTLRGLSDISPEEIWAHVRSLVMSHQLIRLQPVNSPDQPTAARTAEAQQATFDWAAQWHQADDTRDLQRPGVHLYYTLKSSKSSNSSSSTNTSSSANSSNRSLRMPKCEYIVGCVESESGEPLYHRLDSKMCGQLTNELWYVHIDRKSMYFIMGITEGGREKEWDAPPFHTVTDTDSRDRHPFARVCSLESYYSIKHEGIYLLHEGVVHTLWPEETIIREACLDILSLLDKEAMTANSAHILYTTSWRHPRCHYRRADFISNIVREVRWTGSPGVRCEGVPEGEGDLFHISMAWHENLRILFNDGNEEKTVWDHPRDGSGAYVIPSPGLYVISQSCMYSASTFNAADDGLLLHIYQLLEAKTADMATADEHRETQGELRALASRLSTSGLCRE